MVKILSFFIILYFNSLSWADPVIHIPMPNHDFKELVQGDVTKHAYPILNKGDKDLEILEVKPSCGCTAGKLTKQTIPPGDTAFLEITFDSEKFYGP